MQINLRRIRGLMAEHDDTIKTLAEKIGVSATTVGNYLMGRTMMTIAIASRIASIYNIDSFDLLEK